MLGTDQPAGIIEPGSAKNACTALVPLAEPVRWTNRPPPRSLPEPTFVTQLIATSEHFPQARSPRRAEMNDALLAYAAAPRVQRSGLHTRQSI